MTMRTRVIPTAGFTFSTDYVERNAGTGSTTWKPYAGMSPLYRRLVIPGIQVTESEGHPWASRKRGSNKDIGGDFFTQKKYVVGSIPKYRINCKWPRGDGFTYDMRSSTLISGTSLPLELFTTSHTTVEDGKTISIFRLGPSSFPPPSISSDDDLDEIGATAISLCKPTNSIADLSVAIGELAKDGLPKIAGSTLWKEKISKARSDSKTSLRKDLSNEHLNYQFGIKPLLKDIKDFTKGISNIDDIIRQFEDNAGKDVRRRWNFPEERTVTEAIIPGSLAFQQVSGVGSPYSSSGTLTRRREIVVKRWFSGCFTYTLPPGMSSRTKLGEIRLKADRLGVDPDLDTLYNVAPWSWAIDWFSNVGDVVSNFNDFQKYGMIMRYGYVMEHVRVSDTYRREGAVLKDGSPLRLPSTTLVTETKRRRKANPFGFGVRWEGLSPLQLSIAAALGISRGR